MYRRHSLNPKVILLLQRTIILFATVLVTICLGGVYAWSTFAGALKEQHSFTAAQAQLVFGVTIAVFTLTMVLAGRAEQRFGPRPIAMLGGVLFGLGYLVASKSGGELAGVLLGIGVLGGMGIGCGYVCPLATCIRWFPHLKGLITGVAVAGFGGGAILLSQIVERMLDAGMPVLDIFGWLAVLYGSAVVLGGFLLQNPKRANNGNLEAFAPATGLLRDRRFIALAIAMFCGTFSGLLVVGSLKQIGLSDGMTERIAVLAISVFALGNAAGRILWGGLLDIFGERAIPASLVFLAVGVGMIALPIHWPWAFLLLALVIGLGFGACFVVYAAETAIQFGAENVGRVYPLVFLFYGLAALTGPLVGGWLYDTTGSFFTAIVLAAVIPLVGAVTYHTLRTFFPQVKHSKPAGQVTGRPVSSTGTE